VLGNNVNVGIGTSTPAYPLNFAQTIGDKISLYGVGAHYGFGVQNNLLQVHTDGAGSNIAFGYGSSSAFTENMRIQGNGNLHVRGSVSAVSSFYTSDSRFKNDITVIENGLDKITQLNGYNYFWKDEEQDPSLQSGVIAQEVQAVFPELVKADEKGMLSVNYVGLIPYLIQSTKEQQKQIEKIQQQQMITTDHEKIQMLTREVEELKKMVKQLAGGK